jgi:hypothetical protein
MSVYPPLGCNVQQRVVLVEPVVDVSVEPVSHHLDRLFFVSLHHVSGELEHGEAFTARHQAAEQFSGGVTTFY